MEKVFHFKRQDCDAIIWKDTQDHDNLYAWIGSKGSYETTGLQPEISNEDKKQLFKITRSKDIFLNDYENFCGLKDSIGSFLKAWPHVFGNQPQRCFGFRVL